MSSPRRLETAPNQPVPPALADEVRLELEAGHVVALPTETVYGLAARADHPAALERLCRIKGRDTAAGLTWHAGSPAAVHGFSEHPRLVARIADRFWPGPLTLVLRGTQPGLESIARDGWTGLRVPAHPALCSLLEHCPFPVVMTSANRGGEPPATDAAAVNGSLGEAVSLLVDSGPATIAEASTVLRVGPGRFQILREGLLEAGDLRRAAGLAIGFVCTGNTCRSPMAQMLAQDVLARRLAGDASDSDTPEAFGFHTGSAGVFAGTGSPAAEHAIHTLRERGLDLTRHRSQPATPEVVRGWDRVYGLTRSHLQALAESLPPSRFERLELLDPDGDDIPDPIGGTLADYKHCAQRIEECLERRADEWI